MAARGAGSEKRDDLEHHAEATLTGLPDIVVSVNNTAELKPCHELASLQHVRLLAFLDVDERPTVAFSTVQSSDGSYECAQHLYENAALQRLYSDKRERFAYIDAARNKVKRTSSVLPSFHINVRGQHCTCTVVASTWLFISVTSHTSVNVAQHNASDAIVPSEEEALRTSTKPVLALDTHGLVSVGDERLAIGRDDSRDQFMRNAASLGWTRFPNFVITPHMKRILDYPWHETPMGPIESWSTVCKLSVSAMLTNPAPRALFWGPKLTTVYNEQCIPIYGQKHPGVLGISPEQAWPETWAKSKPMFEAAVNGGKAVKIDDMQCFLMRNSTGSLEEAFFSSTYIPIPGLDGGGDGVLIQFSEVTDQAIERRQQAVINGINEKAWKVESPTDYWTAAMDPLVEETADIAYALLISSTNSHPPDGTSIKNTAYQLHHMIGFEKSPLESESPFQLDVNEPTHDGIIAAIKQAHAKDDRILFLTKANGTLPPSLNVSHAGRGFGDTVIAAAVIPIVSIQNEPPVGFLIVGLNPRRPIDGRSRTFVQVLRDSLVKAAATAALPSGSRNSERELQALHQSLLHRLHRSTREMQRVKRRFETMAASTRVGMFMFTSDGRLPIYTNDEYLHLMDLTREELEQDGNWGHKVHEDDQVRVGTAFAQFLQDKAPVTIEFRTKKDFQFIDEVTGQTIAAPQIVVCTSYPEIDENGNCLNIQGWVYNVSKDKFAQRLLNSRLEEVTASKQHAENFIDMVSHEMRNPLGAILQSADGIVAVLEHLAHHTGTRALNLTEETVESVLEASETIILCAQHQKRIVDDILTLSKLDANLLVIAPDKSNPASLLRKALRMFESQLARADIRATVEVEPSVAAIDIDDVMMDQSRVLQVVINLLSNGLKFTQHSKKRAIALCLGASIHEPTDADVHYIPRRENRPVHHWTQEWGSGQELYLTFMVRDTGKGLTDVEMATLFQRFSQASPKTYKKYGGSGLGLFISRELTELQGGQIGVSSVAGEGSTFAFYVLVRRWLPRTPMSVGSGTRSVDVHTPLVLESPVAYTRRGSSALFDSSASLAALAEVMVPTTVPEKKVELKMTVLIVEDNVINQKVMAKQIRAQGHVVYVANHGLEALEFLRTTTFWHAPREGPKGQPDYLNQGLPRQDNGAAIDLSVILMDLEMPVLDGLSCVKQIREMEAKGELTGHIPVIAVTANARSEQISGALQHGMDEVVTKPFRIWQVLERARGLIEKEGSGLSIPPS